MQDDDETRQAALTRIMAIANKHQLSPEDIYAFLNSEAEEFVPRGSIINKVLVYLGGMFIAAGMLAFIALQWEHFSSLIRVVLTLGAGTGMFIGAVRLVLNKPTDSSKASIFGMPGLVIGSLLQATGIMVAFHEYGSDGDAQVAALITCLFLTAQMSLTTWRLGDTTAAWLMAFFGSAAWWLAFDLMAFDAAVTGLTLGIIWLGSGAFIQRRYPSLLSEQFFLLGSWALMASVFDLLTGTPFELLFMPVACALMFFGVWLNSRTLNFASAAGLLAFTAYFTGEHFADSIGWPLALILTGILMLVISKLALRIDRTYLRNTNNAKTKN